MTHCADQPEIEMRRALAGAKTHGQQAAAYDCLAGLYQRQNRPDDVRLCLRMRLQLADRVPITDFAPYVWLLDVDAQRGNTAHILWLCDQLARAGWSGAENRIDAVLRGAARPRARFAAVGWLLLEGVSLLAVGRYLLVDFSLTLVNVLLLIAAGLLWWLTAGLLGQGPRRERVLRLALAVRRRALGAALGAALVIFTGLLLWALLTTAGAWAARGAVVALLAWGAALIWLPGLTGYDLRAWGSRIGRHRGSGALVTLVTVLLLLAGGEWLLRHGPTLSNTFAIGLTHTRWFEQHWQPRNELQYRDDPILPDVVPDGGRVLVLGDSFAAGAGVNDIDDTFPQRLERFMGPDYRVHLAARPGWNTQDQIAALADYPVTPDVVILSYFLNDIADAADQLAVVVYFGLLPSPQGIPQIVIDNLYLPSFLYWNVYLQILRGGLQDYGALLQVSYSTPEIWQRHATDLEQLLAGVEARGAQLVVLIWPDLAQIETSEWPARQVAHFFERRGVPVVNLAETLRGQPAHTLMVSPFDSHPNPHAHQQAAAALFDLLNQRVGLLTQDVVTGGAG